MTGILRNRSRKRPNLIESRWAVSNLTPTAGRVRFEAQGYGDGDMVWQVGAPGRYRATFGGKSVDAVVGDDRLLNPSLKTPATTPLSVMLAKVGP